MAAVTLQMLAAAGSGDNSAPSITSSNAVSVAENATLSHSLTASETVSWSIVGGADQSKLEISGSTLRWASNGTKDYEAPDDADTDNAYVVTVRATDLSSNTTDQTITVTVTDVGDAVAQTFAGALAYTGTTQTGQNFTANTYPAGALTFNSESYDTDTIHSTSSATGRLTVPSALNGKYGVIRANVLMTNVTNYNYYISIYKNGSPTFNGWGGAQGIGHNTEMRANCWTAPLLLATGDYYEVFVYSTDSSTDVFNNSTSLSLEVVG